MGKKQSNAEIQERLGRRSVDGKKPQTCEICVTLKEMTLLETTLDGQSEKR